MIRSRARHGVASGRPSRPWVLAILIALPSLGPATEGRAGAREVLGKIRGTVVDEARVPLSGLMVQLRARGQGGLLRVTGTDEKGRYAFTDLPAGTYEVIVSADGYQEQKKPGILVKPPFQNIVGFTVRPATESESTDPVLQTGDQRKPGGTLATGGLRPLPARFPERGAAEVVSSPASFVTPREKPRPSVTVRGRLLDQAKRGIPEVSVTLVSLDKSSAYQALSEEDGSFRIDAVPSGRYRVLVASPGHVALDLKSVDVAPENGLNLSLTLVDYPLDSRGRLHELLPRERPRPVPSDDATPEATPAEAPGAP